MSTGRARENVRSECSRGNVESSRDSGGEGDDGVVGDNGERWGRARGFCRYRKSEECQVREYMQRGESTRVRRVRAEGADRRSWEAGDGSNVALVITNAS